MIYGASLQSTLVSANTLLAATTHSLLPSAIPTPVLARGELSSFHTLIGTTVLSGILSPSLQALLTVTTAGMILGTVIRDRKVTNIMKVAESDPEAVKKLFQMADEGQTEAREALKLLVPNHPHAVGALYDLAQAGDQDAWDFLLVVDIEQLKRAAVLDYHAIYALSHLAALGRDDAESALINCDGTYFAQEAKRDPYAIFALSRLADAGNEAARYVFTRFDISSIVEEAKYQSRWVHVLEHFSKHGNSEATRVMKTLDVRALAQSDRADNHTIFALRLLVERGNESAIMTLAEIGRTQGEAMIVLRGLTAGGHGHIFRVLARASQTNPHAVLALAELAQDDHLAASNLLKNIDVTPYSRVAQDDPKAVEALRVLIEAENPDAIVALADLGESVPEATRTFNELMANPDTSVRDTLIRLVQHKPQVIAAIGRSAQAGDKAALEMLVTIGETQREAVIALSAVAKKGNKTALKLLAKMALDNSYAVDALQTFAKDGRRTAIRALTEAATINPHAVFALNALAEDEIKSAKAALRSLDVSSLAQKAVRDDPAAAEALAYLATHDNEAAKPFSIALARTNPHVLSNQEWRRVTADPKLRELLTNLDLDTDIYMKAMGRGEIDKTEMIDTLAGLTRWGNESAFRIIVAAAEKDQWALWTLDCLRFSTSMASAALQKLDARALAAAAERAPYATLGFIYLTRAGNKAAIALARELDVGKLTFMAASNHPEASQALSGLRELAILDNAAAFAALKELMKSVPAAVPQLKSVALAEQAYSDEAQQILEQLNSKDTLPPR